MKTTTLTGIDPIPVEYVLGIAQTKATDAQRRPYIDLIERWGDEMNCVDEARRLLRQLRNGQEIDTRKMPREFMPHYRQPEVAEQLIEIIRKIDAVIVAKQEKWTWAHVMRVMVDEGILYNPPSTVSTNSSARWSLHAKATRSASMATMPTSCDRKTRGPSGRRSLTSIPTWQLHAPSATKSPSSLHPSSPVKSVQNCKSIRNLL